MTSILVASNIQIDVRITISSRGNLCIGVPYPVSQVILDSLKEVARQEMSTIDLNIGQTIRQVSSDYYTVLFRTHHNKYNFTFHTNTIEPVPDLE
jgi:hypothetical protein